MARSRSIMSAWHPPSTGLTEGRLIRSSVSSTVSDSRAGVGAAGGGVGVGGPGGISATTAPLGGSPCRPAP